MKQKMIEISPDTAQSLLLYSFRYTLGRASYAPGHFQDMFDLIYPQLPEGIQKFLVERFLKELDEYFRYEEAESDLQLSNYSVSVWYGFNNKLKKLKEAMDE